MDSACPLWIEAAALFRAIGDRFNESKTLSNLAWAAEFGKQFAEAGEWVYACRRVQISLGDSRGLAITAAALGRIAYHRGELAEARAQQLEALLAFLQFGERRRAVESLVHWPPWPTPTDATTGRCACSAQRRRSSSGWGRPWATRRSSTKRY